MNLRTAAAHLYRPEYLVKQQPPDDGSYDTRRVYSSLFRISWPAALETLLVGLVSFIDTVMVGKVGSAAIAAVGITNQPKFLFYAIFFAVNVGVTAVVSRRKGEDDRERANSCLGQAFTICAILSAVLCTAAVLLSEPLIRFAGAGDEYIDDACDYFRIVMVGMSFTALSAVINAAQRGIGNTRIAMVTNIAANVVNIILNYLLIGGNFGFPRLEVRGAAIATLVGNAVCFIIALASVLRKQGFLRLTGRSLVRFDADTVRLIASISSSAAVEQLFIRIGFFVYAMLVAKLGTIPLATHQICMNIINLSFCVGDGLGMAASSLVGQNLGKKRPDLAEVYGKASQRVGIMISAFLVMLFLFGGRMLMALFTDDNTIIEYGIKLLIIVAVCSPAQVSQVIFSGCLRGAGDTKYVALVSFISIGVFRPMLTYVFCYTLGLGLIGAWLSLLVDQYTRLFFSATRFSRGKWKEIRI